MKILFILNYRAGTNVWQFLNGRHTVAFFASNKTRAIVGGQPLTNPNVQEDMGNKFWLPTVPAKQVICDYYYSLGHINVGQTHDAFYVSHGDWWGPAKSTETPEPYEVECEPRYGPKELLAKGPEWRFIYICRDGRNQIESLRNIPGGIEQELNAKDPQDYFEVLCKGYRNRMRMALDCNKQIPSFKIIRFEDLVSNPVGTMDRMYSHLGLYVNKNFVQQAWDYSIEKGMNKQHSSFQGKGKLHQRWESWTEEEQATFERIAGKELRELGYGR